AQHQRPVAAEQGGKRRFAVPGGESAQELAVGGVLERLLLRQMTEVPQDGVEVCGGHAVDSPAVGRSSSPYLSRARRPANLSAIFAGWPGRGGSIRAGSVSDGEA